MMKTEPIEPSTDGDENDNAIGHEFKLDIAETDMDIDIKYIFHAPLETQQEEHNALPITILNVDPQNLKKPTTLSYFNENDEDRDSQAELDEIEGIINEGEVHVDERKPVVFPIPKILPDTDEEDNKGNVTIKIKPEIKAGMRRPKPCMCIICKTGFPNQQLFQLHMSSVHREQRPYQCSHCGKGFASPNCLIKHETIHDPKRFEGEPKFACDLCDKKYHLKLSLTTHRKVQHFGYKRQKRPSTALLIEHHAIGGKNPHQPKKIKKVFKCPYCDMTFELRCYMQKHLVCHTEERPHQCQECGQKCTSMPVLRTHIQNVHRNLTVRRFRTFRPRSMANEPCPCNICGKIFNLPSRLQTHMYLHTGEKPFECLTCGQYFRTPDNLRRHQFRHLNRNDEVNEYNTHKCLICGKDGILRFTEAQNHRFTVHRHIPMPDDPDKEKPYACGICGKPYYTRGQAIVCAIQNHDPTTLHNAMFKFKCEACPEASFGFHSTFALRRHWEKEHTDKPFPVKYRASAGMYEKGKGREDSLRTVKINRELEKSIKKNGPPKGEYDFTLYTEFDLLPVAVKFYRDLRKQKRESKPKPTYKEKKANITCDICGSMIVYRSNMKRHMKTHKKRKGFPKPFRSKRTVARHNCNICSKGFLKLTRLRLHERKLHNLKADGTPVGPVIKKRPGRPAKRTPSLKPVASAKMKGKVGRPRKQLLSTDLMMVVKERETAGSPFINLNGAVAVNSVLDNQGACLVLPQVTVISNKAGGERETPIIDKVLKIILRRVDEEELS